MIPVTTIGGYLGAGKTTVVNHMLRHANGARLAILVNEFGQLAIDEDLIIAQGDEMISIAGGCICCSFGDNLVGAMMDLAALDPAPDHIVIEASGVAIPGAIAASISLLPGFRHDGIIVLADAETIRARAGDKYVGDTIMRQLADADIILLTKTDLVAPAALDDTTQWLATQSPAARILPITGGRIAPAILLDRFARLAPYETSPHADHLFESLTLPMRASVDATALAQALVNPAFGIVRAKGHVTGPAGDKWLIQIVGQRFDVTRSDIDAPDQIVCIGLTGQLDKPAIQKLNP